MSFGKQRLEQFLSLHPGLPLDAAKTAFIAGFNAACDKDCLQVDALTQEIAALREENARLTADWRAIVSRITSFFHAQSSDIHAN